MYIHIYVPMHFKDTFSSCKPCTHLQICVYIFNYIHTYIYIHIYTYIHTMMLRDRADARTVANLQRSVVALEVKVRNPRIPPFQEEDVVLA